MSLSNILTGNVHQPSDVPWANLTINNLNMNDLTVGLINGKQPPENITLEPIGNSPNAEGASIDASGHLTLQPADGVHGGLITAGDQILSGNKTLQGALTTSNIVLTDPGVITSSVVLTDGANKLVTGNVNLSNQVDNILSISHGGTNSATALSNGKFMISSAGKIIEGPTISSFGDTGPTGAQGSQGIKGDTGQQGAQGIQGNTGPGIGAQGAQGDTGPIGPQGPGVGAQGDTGPIGPQGNTGAQGAQGIQGDTGAIGPQGNTGAQGSQGIQGDTGPIGPQGAKGDTGFVGTLAAIGASPNANGATLSGTTLNLEPASSSFGGVVTTAVQTFAGVKTLTLPVIADTTTPSKTITFSTTNNTAAKSLTLASQVTDNRSIFFPDANDTLVGLMTSDILENKRLDSTDCTFIGHTDSTKVLQFSVSGNTSGKTATMSFAATNNLTYSVPDATGSTSFIINDIASATTQTVAGSFNVASGKVYQIAGNSVTSYETREIIPLPCIVTTTSTRAAATTFVGAQYKIPKAFTVTAMSFSLSTATTPGSMVVAIYQATNGVAASSGNLANLVAYGNVTGAAGLNNITTVSGGGLITTGVCYILWGMVSGTMTARTFTNNSFLIFNGADIPSGYAPITFTTAITVTTTPASTLDPTAQTATTTDVALTMRLR